MNMQTRPFDGLKRLLVATDYSRFSEGAVREALNLSKLYASWLTAMAVIKTSLEFELTYPQVIEKEDQIATNHLETIRAKARAEGVSCRTIMEHSHEPYETIFDSAINSRADMIIVGRHGRTRLLKFLMGSVTAKVCDAPCNVLIVPPESNVEYKNILAATDGSKSGFAAVSEAIGIAKRCGGYLAVVSVAESDTNSESIKNDMKRIVDLASREGVKADGITPMGKPYKAILETAKQRHADLIVVGSHGMTGLGKFLMGSVTEQIIRRSEAAVLVVKAA